jgi:hypothetical protein
VNSSKNHFLVVDGVKMRSKKTAGSPKRKNDKAIASDSITCLIKVMIDLAVAAIVPDELEVLGDTK